MAILLTGDVDLVRLARWIRGVEAPTAALLVNAHGWLLRVPGQSDFVIEPDGEPLTSTHEPFSADELNAAILLTESAKLKHPLGWNCLAEVGLTPINSYVRYAFVNADAHLARLDREEDHRIIYSAGWLNGLMVGASLAAGRR